MSYTGSAIPPHPPDPSIWRIMFVLIWDYDLWYLGLCSYSVYVPGQISFFLSSDQFNWLAQQIWALSKQDNLKCWSQSVSGVWWYCSFVRTPNFCDGKYTWCLWLEYLRQVECSTLVFPSGMFSYGETLLKSTCYGAIKCCLEEPGYSYPEIMLSDLFEWKILL